MALGMSDVVPPDLPGERGNTPPPPVGQVPPKKEKNGLLTGCIIAAVVVFVIVFVIGILAALAMPAFTKVQAKAKETRSLNTAYNLKNAIAVYFSEYNRWPVTHEEGKDVEARSEGTIVKVLTGVDSEGQNPRQVVFYSGEVVNASGEYPGIVDAWGHHYFIIVDSNFDNQIDDPAGSGTLDESILIWSAGPDGVSTTWEDNVVSW